MPIVNSQPVPIAIVGSSTFGVYPKISVEKTLNMYITDEWLCSYAGFQKVIELLGSNGRAAFHSIRGNFVIVVIGSAVYRISPSLAVSRIGSLDTLFGEVFIDENLGDQIGIVDGRNAYIYNYFESSFTQQTLTNSLTHTITPSYISYHNSFFLIAGGNSVDESFQWYVFEKTSESTIGRVAVGSEFPLQTKPDKALAVKRLPGRGNNVLVLGSTVAEVWTQVGGSQNYVRVSSYSIDYGCVSISTIAASEEFICWLAQNENNAPSIMVSNGAETKRISTDGIDNRMGQIKRPDQSTAFFYRQNGHLFYHITFFNEQDNLSLIYDFTTEKFFHVSDQNQDYYPARQVVFFNEKTYFVSLDDGSFYEMGEKFVTYNYTLDDDDQDDVGEEIPRIRVCNTVRSPDTRTFRAGRFTFLLEQGVNDFYLISTADGRYCDGLMITEQGDDFMITEDGDLMLTEDGACLEDVNAFRPRIDLSVSKNGGQSFSNDVPRYLNSSGHYRNQIRWDRLGRANEFTLQLRFIGFQRFVASNGFLEVY